MKMQYPNNFKEMIIMTSTNCMIMVCGMMGFNLWYYNALSVDSFLPPLSQCSSRPEPWIFLQKKL